MRLTLPLALLLAASALAQDAENPAPRVRSTIERAITWLAAQQKPVAGDARAILFAAKGEAPRQPQVYGGSAGTLIFLENAAAVLDSDEARALADACAAGLLATKRSQDDEPLAWMHESALGTAALYVGDAGIGHAFLVRARLRGDRDALATATAVGDALLERGKREGDRLSWDEQVEVIYGGAGTALFLLELGQETKEARFVDAARAVGRWLIDRAEVIEPKEGEAKEGEGQRLLSWRWQMAGNTEFLNFSHGTAGVAYALARIGAEADEAECARAAQDGAAFLLEQMRREGDTAVWPVVRDTDPTMGGWCHGPPGTARLFLYLHGVTGEKRYLDVALASARWVMAQAPAEADAADAAAAAGEFPPSFCCGVAGVLDFFCDLHRVTRAPEHAAFARRAGAFLIDVARPDGEGVKWARGRSAHPGSKGLCSTDLMLGAAGEGMALLRLLTIAQDPDPVCHLPDRRVTAPAAAARKG